MITSTPGVNLIQVQESTSPLLKWNNVDRWLRIRDKRKRQKGNSKEDIHKKVHIQINISEYFDRCINSMNSLSLSTTDEERFVQIFQQSFNTIKDDSVHIGGNWPNCLIKEGIQ